MILAKDGLKWIKDGFFLFRKRPFMLTNVFVLYFLSIMVLGSLPFIGGILPPFIAPILSMCFLQAVCDASNDQPFRFKALFAHFNKKSLASLISLGGLYFIIAVISVYVSSFADGGIFMNAMLGKEYDVETLMASNFQRAFLLAGLFNLIGVALFWFVAPLIVWRQMPLIQSIFYNIVTLIRLWRPVLVYVVGLFLFCFLIPMLINTLIILFVGQQFGVLIAFAVLMFVAVLVYCSFFCMYTSIFGKPGESKWN